MRTDQPKKTLRRHFILLSPALIMLVSACATTDQMTPRQVPPNADGITPMTLTIVGEESNIRLASEIQLRNGIKDFADNSNPTNLGQLIAELRSSNQNRNKNAPAFTGISGALTHEFLNVANEALNASGQYDQAGKRVVVSMEGKIIDYEYYGSVGNPGNGKLTVITAITSRVIPKGAGNPPPKTVGYKWEIEVQNNGFEVRSHSGNDSDPFPNTMTFNQSMLNRVQSLGFRYKLWAKGTDIVVKNVWRDMNFDWQNPNWGMPLPSANPNWRRFYESDSDSCIDMMFVNPPPATFAELQGPPFYCLGRCAHPGVVNSR